MNLIKYLTKSQTFGTGLAEECLVNLNKVIFTYEPKGPDAI